MYVKVERLNQRSVFKAATFELTIMMVHSNFESKKLVRVGWRRLSPIIQFPKYIGSAPASQNVAYLVII